MPAAIEANVAWALRYAARGWPVFPVHAMLTDPSGQWRCDCLRTECRNPGKHPWTARGLHDATTEAALISTYWQRWPEANVGIACGPDARLVILDIDPRNGGDATLARLVATHGALPETATALTGGGGQHYYFAHPNDVVVTGRKIPAWGGIDVKAAGGYVLAPPSNHASRQAYCWEASSDPFDSDRPAALAPVPPWVLAALQEESRAAAAAADALPIKIGAGQRNNTLASLAGTLRKRGCSPTEIEAALRGVNQERCDPPLADDEVAAIARSIGRYRAGAAARTPDGGDLVIEPPTNGATPVAPGTAPVPEGLPPEDQTRCTDVGNALRLAQYFGDRIRYVPDWDEWVAWDGRCWARDPVLLAMIEYAKKMARFIYGEANTCRDDTMREQLGKWAHRSEGRERLRAAVDLARSVAGIPLRSEQLDARSGVLNIENGLLDLATGTLRPHDPAEFCSLMAPMAYDPTATAPRWEKFLADVTGNDQALQDFLRVLCGYMVTGHATEHVMPVVYGTGRNGKSTMLRVLQKLLGPYAKSADPSIFLKHKRNPESPNPEIVRLEGARLVVAIETEEGARLAENVVKAMTGGDRMVARDLYEKPREFDPRFVPFLVTNHRPQVRGTDLAIWRRLRLVPFTVQIPVEQVDQDLVEKLLEERSGILNWLMDGAAEWYERGLPAPACVTLATEEYRSDMDDFGAWLEECCEIDAKNAEAFSTILKHFNGWREERGERSWSAKALGSKLIERGMERVLHPVTRQKMYRGIRISSSVRGPNFGF